MTWIDYVLEAVKDSESPKKYFLWTALTSISAVVKDNVYLERGGLYELFCNIFVVLVGPSGIKKGIPVNLARKLVNEVGNARSYSGRLTIQKMINELSKAYSDDKGNIIKEAQAVLFAPEFSSFIARDPEALTILTDLYNTHEHREGWINYTKKDDKEKLIKPCLTLFGASNEVHLKEVVPMNALGGGFIARTFMVHATESGTRNPLTEDKPPIDIKCLASYLKELALLKGRFLWSNAGKDLYNKWYDEYGEEEKRDETGTAARITDSVLKVAMLLSLSRSTEMILQMEDIKNAIDICADTMIGVRKITMGSGKNPLGPQTALVIRYLLKQENYQDTRENILGKNWGNFDSFELERIIETLTQMRAISLQRGGVYKLSEKIIKNYEAQKEKK